MAEEIELRIKDDFDRSKRDADKLARSVDKLSSSEDKLGRQTKEVTKAQRDENATRSRALRLQAQQVEVEKQRAIRAQRTQRVLQAAGRFGGTFGGLVGQSAEGAGQGVGGFALGAAFIAAGVSVRALVSSIDREIELIKKQNEARVGLTKRMREADKQTANALGQSLLSQGSNIAIAQATLGASGSREIQTALRRGGVSNPEAVSAQIGRIAPTADNGQQKTLIQTAARLEKFGIDAASFFARLDRSNVRDPVQLIRQAVGEVLGKEIDVDTLRGLERNLRGGPASAVSKIRAEQGKAASASMEAAVERLDIILHNIRQGRGELLAGGASVQAAESKEALEQLRNLETIKNELSGSARVWNTIKDRLNQRLGLTSGGLGTESENIRSTLTGLGEAR